MSVMVIVAVHLGHIEKNLKFWGFGRIRHISCRNVGDQKKLAISPSTSLIVVMIDFVNHGAARCIKEQAKTHGIPMVFAKRSWVSIAGQLDKLGILCKGSR
ncbi:MAG: DUF2325 domain-containing protein [Negativicutes bacterium]